MNSGELASRAGVTVRTLRHYHQIGILPEPPRGENGYRRYDVHQLVRVLRIKRLAALGIPLERIPELLDEPGAEASQRVLAELDAELRAQIRQLQAQRRVVAELRAADAPPDLPIALARLARMYGDGDGSGFAAVDREQGVLVAQFLGTERMEEVAGTLEAIAQAAPPDAFAGLIRRFDAVGAGTADAEVDALAAELLELLRPALPALDALTPALDATGGTALLEEHLAGALNPQQSRVLARFAELTQPATD